MEDFFLERFFRQLFLDSAQAPPRSRGRLPQDAADISQNWVENAPRSPKSFQNGSWKPPGGPWAPGASPGATLEGPPPTHLCGAMLSRGYRGFLVCVVCLVLTRVFEKSQNGGPEGRKSSQNGFRKPLGRLLGRPGAPRGVHLNRPVAF